MSSPAEDIFGGLLLELSIQVSDTAVITSRSSLSMVLSFGLTSQI